MDFKTFLEHFDTIAQAPNGITKLRSLILDLAVRGKLVPQDPDDEPAKELLKVISNKHLELGKEFRKPQNLPLIEDVEKPFELPTGWCWCRFTEIGQLERGKSKHRPRNDPTLYKNGYIPLVQTGDVARANGRITTYTALYNNEGLAQSRLWSKGTLCITIAANIGDSAILDFDACFPDSIVGFSPTEPISDSKYFEFFMRTLKSHLEDFAPSTAQKNINLAILDEVLIPLPPLAEQKRIVEKVDELMALCDRLQDSQETRDQVRQKLRESAIASLMNAETDEELQKNWAIVRDNWHTLSQKPEDVNDLRRSVLQLAVQGKLSVQDPTDQSAFLVADQIKEKKKSATKSTQSNTNKAIRIPFEIPSNWIWLRINDLYDVSGGIQKTPKRKPVSNYFPYLRVANVQRGYLNLEEIEYFELLEGELERWNLQPGDLLIVEGNGSEKEIGRCAIWNGEIEKCVHQNHIIRARPIGYNGQVFTLMFLNSPSGMAEMRDLAITTSGLYSLSVGKIREILVPFPPLAEQKQIVAKVNELMQMCDRLEESLRQSQQWVEALAASSISHLTV
jgi:type I restriction enzyme S subunit